MHMFPTETTAFPILYLQVTSLSSIRLLALNVAQLQNYSSLLLTSFAPAWIMLMLMTITPNATLSIAGTVFQLRVLNLM